MEKSKIGSVRNWIAYVIGVIIIQFGVAIFLELNLGTDPFTILTQGIARTFYITPGMANRILTLGMLAILFFIDRKYINIGTIIAIIAVGFVLDGMIGLVAPLHLGNMLFGIRIVILVIAGIIIGIGFPIMKLAGLGLAPNDVIYMSIVENLHKPYGMVRMCVDALYLILGYLLNGVVGIGTVFCVVCLGPMMGFLMNRLEKPIVKIIG